jgi:hypothetical protein
MPTRHEPGEWHVHYFLFGLTQNRFSDAVVHSRWNDIAQALFVMLDDTHP